MGDKYYYATDEEDEVAEEGFPITWQEWCHRDSLYSRIFSSLVESGVSPELIGIYDELESVKHFPCSDHTAKYYLEVKNSSKKYKKNQHGPVQGKKKRGPKVKDKNKDKNRKIKVPKKIKNNLNSKMPLTYFVAGKKMTEIDQYDLSTNEIIRVWP